MIPSNQNSPANLNQGSSASYSSACRSTDYLRFRTGLSLSLNLIWLVGFSVCTVLMSSAADVVTYHNDIARTGQNRQETILTLGNVKSSRFGKLFAFPVDGMVDAEPLYLSAV